MERCLSIRMQTLTQFKRMYCQSTEHSSTQWRVVFQYCSQTARWNKTRRVFCCRHVAGKNVFLHDARLPGMTLCRRVAPDVSEGQCLHLQGSLSLRAVHHWSCFLLLMTRDRPHTLKTPPRARASRRFTGPACYVQSLNIHLAVPAIICPTDRQRQTKISWTWTHIRWHRI